MEKEYNDNNVGIKDDYYNSSNDKEIEIKPSMDVVFQKLFGNDYNKDILVHYFI